MRLRRSPVPFLVALLLAPAVLFPCPAQAAAISIDGRAVGSDGRGIAGARVELRPILSRYAQGVREALGQGLPEPEARMVTGTDGRFTLRAPRAGMWEVTVSAAGFVPSTGRLLPLREAASLPDSELRRDADGPLPLGDQARLPRTEPRRIVVQEVDGGAPPGVVVRDPTSLLVLGQIPPGQRRATVPAGVGTYLLLETADGRRALVPPAAAALPEVRVLLPRPAARTGLVLDAATHRPLAGAQVWMMDDPAAAVTSDAAGHYRLEASAVGRSGLAATAAGHADLFLEEAPGPFGDLPVLSLIPTIPLGGRVVDERGNPVADAIVTAAGRDVLVRVRSRADGRFRFPHLPAGATCLLIARHSGFAPDSRKLPALTVASPEPRIVLHRGTAVVGTAVDEAGRPVAGAAVEIIGFDPSISALPDSTRTETGVDGSFILRDLPPARFQLSIVRPNAAPFVKAGIEAGPAGAITDLGRIVLPAGSMLSGRIHDPQGRPLAGVRIWVMDEVWTPRPDTVTGEDGTFTLAGLPPQGSLSLNLCREGAVSALIDLKETPAEPLDLVLRPAARIAGRVLGPDGAPFAGAWTSTVREPRDWDRVCGLTVSLPCDPPSRQSDGEGRFALSELEPGVYTLQVWASGFANAEVKGLRVHAGEEIDGIEVRLQPDAPDEHAADEDAREQPKDPVFEVRGRVMGPDGAPVAGAVVYGLRENVSSAPDGSFSVPLPAAGGDLTAHAHGYGSGHTAVAAAPAEGVEIRLDEEVALSGTIRGPSPREMAWVRVSADGKDGRSPGAVAADGTYRILHLSPGKAEIVAGTASVFVKREIEIPRGQWEVTLDLDLEVAPTTEVRGRVTGPGREPIPRAKILASRQDGLTREAFTRADGTFVLRLEDGTWSGKAHADGYIAGSADPFEVSGGAAPMEIRMERAAVLHGQFPGLAADEVPSVLATGKSGSRPGEADPDGGYLVTGLEPGTWTVTGRLHVEGTWNGVRTTSGQVTLQPGGGDAFLDLDFAIGGLTLTARAPEGRKISQADLLLPDGTVIFSTGMIEDPAVRFNRLRPGAYRLRWTPLGDCPPKSTEQKLTLTADREIVLDRESHPQ
jgi:protocatechuate 3,4-dioxygenase beta subunit